MIMTIGTKMVRWWGIWSTCIVVLGCIEVKFGRGTFDDVNKLKNKCICFCSRYLIRSVCLERSSV